MKIITIILLFVLIGCSKVPCGKMDRRAYKYGDKATIIAGFYKGQKGTIIKESWWYETRKSDKLLTNDSLCSSPAFIVRLNDGAEVKLGQTNLFVDDEQHYMLCSKEKCDMIKREKVEVKKKPISCIDEKRSKFLDCGDDLQCKMQVVLNSKHCVRNSE